MIHGGEPGEDPGHRAREDSGDRGAEGRNQEPADGPPGTEGEESKANQKSEDETEDETQEMRAQKTGNAGRREMREVEKPGTADIGRLIKQEGSNTGVPVQESRKSASPALAPWMNAVISPGV
ncbi:hypothetical protein GCM10010515_30510 [Streptomyces fructofermentans]|uniref:Uncharacterized protein n=1 Tax=Streptomyces fructofermentans TaxID=152141 RepID=A0A918KGU6_9ACTN|nr:hypothetical protein GCM10010515_30510 [Streptomyces fructofermentans]